MIKPLRRGFKMDIYLRFKPEIPDLSGIKAKIYFFFLVSLAILVIGTPFLGLSVQNSQAELSSENDALGEKLLLLDENTIMPVVSPANPEPKIVKKMSVIVTAYSSTPWETQGNPFITASGSWVEDGIIANNYLPFGTKVKMPEIYGDKVFVVEDRMHWRKGNYHVDIWFPSYSEALNFGAKRTYIEVLEG